MAKGSNGEDSFYEKQILEANKYGNALLSELLCEKIGDHKKKLSSRIQIKEEIKLYKKEIDKLRSLKIGCVHNVLKVKEKEDPSLQIEAAERLIKKIEQILKENVCYNASEVISIDEFEELKNNLNILQPLGEIVENVPDTAEEKLQKINKFSQSIDQLLSRVESLEMTVKDCQNNLIKQTSEAINYM